MIHQPRGTRLRAMPAILALALTLGVAACGASSAGDGVVTLADKSAAPGQTAAPTASVDPEEAMLAFTKCMKEHGVDVQIATAVEGSGGGQVHVIEGQAGAGTELQPATGSVDMKAMQAADEACRHLLPAGGMGDPNATMDPALADQMLKFAQCMRDHGVDYPDPQFSGGGVSIQVGGGEAGGIDPASDTFKTAQEACGKELPGGAPDDRGRVELRCERPRHRDPAVKGSRRRRHRADPRRRSRRGGAGASGRCGASVPPVRPRAPHRRRSRATSRPHASSAGRCRPRPTSRAAWATRAPGR